MADIVLTLKAALTHPIDLSCVVPDRFAGLSNEDLGNLPVWSAAAPRSSLRLGDVFSIEGERSSTVRVRGDCRMAEGLGREMRGGQLEIEGNVGSHCGTAMQGGTIRVTGDAGDHLARRAARGLTRRGRRRDRGHRLGRFLGCRANAPWTGLRGRFDR